MTAGELLARADALRPNAYETAEKLRWLERLDGQIARELIDTHAAASPTGAAAAPGAAYTAESVLLAPEPYGEEVYLAYVFAQIDLNNAEIEKYDQSAALFAAAWRALADDINRRTPPKGLKRFVF